MKHIKIPNFTNVTKYELWNLYIIQNKVLSCLNTFVTFVFVFVSKSFKTNQRKPKIFLGNLGYFIKN